MDYQFLAKSMMAGSVNLPVPLLQYHHQLGLEDTDVLLLIHLHGYIQQGEYLPPIAELSKRMALTQSECYIKIQKLIDAKVLKINTEIDAQRRVTERYDLTPLWEKIALQVVNQVEDEVVEEKQARDMSMYALIEREFSRQLSPIEGETIANWTKLEHYEPELIKEALKEAVIAGKKNIRYIDRILSNWQANGVKTLDDAKAASREFGTHTMKTNTKSSPNLTSEAKPAKPFKMYNWLDDNKPKT